MGRLKIGFVTGEYPPMQGGIGAHCHALAAALSDAGHRVAIYTDRRGVSDDSRTALTPDGGHWRWGSLRAIDAWARRERLDVVNLHYQTAMYQMSPFIHILPDVVRAAPVVTTFHDLRVPYLFPKAGRVRTWVVHRLARASAGTVSTNHEDAAALRQVAPSVPVELIPIGSSVRTGLPPDFDAASFRLERGVQPDETVIAHFGFMNHSKGIEVLLDTLAALRAEGLPVRLWMVGGRTGASDPTNADFAAQIDRKITALGLVDAVHWSGFVDEPTASAYLTAADVVALPFLDGASYRRSSLMAVINHGCTIVTTAPVVDVPAFHDGENLRLVPPGDVMALTEALRQLAQDPANRETLRAGARVLRGVFDWGEIARANADFFTRIIQKGRT
ncbi:MAG: glycosyltransferase family 4 protein [Anaerolineae bacterium]|jgi:glycosyltransferase involved in cell wall biosynthesis|nr:glycosyltransferase family 4 protein [Anaerolineae bacterium]